MPHTPGPWNTGGVMTRVEVQPKGWRVPMCVADCHPAGYPPESEAERVANARLIAAAPDLLEALESLVEDYDADDANDDRQDRYIANARRVLRAVKGT